MARSQRPKPAAPCLWCKHPQYAHMNVDDCRAPGCDCEKFVFSYFDSLDDETEKLATAD